MNKLLCSLAISIPLALCTPASAVGLQGSSSGGSAKSFQGGGQGIAVGTYGARNATELVEKLRRSLPMQLNEYLSLGNISNDDRNNYIFHFYSDVGGLTHQVCKNIRSNLAKDRSAKKFRQLFEKDDASVAFKYNAPNNEVCFVDL